MLRRIRHRIPGSLRHRWKLVALCCAVLVGLGVGAADARIRPYVLGDQRQAADLVTEDIAGTVDLFDETVAHTVRLSYTDDAYERMLDAYFDEEEKNWIEADLVVDGTTVPSIGIRLKGNSTLMSLTRDGQPARGGGGPMGDAAAGPRGWQGDQQQAPQGDQQQAPQGDGQQAPQGDGQRVGGMGMTSLSGDQPEALPWLISFDHFVKGRRYQGYQAVAVRAAGSGTATALNEAVALSLVAESGQAAQDYAYTSFMVNDRPAKVRLLVEDPGQQFADDLGDYGVLYKALSTGEFSFQGEDPTEYTDDFKQITRKGSQDVQPVIDLLRWVRDASDAEFAANLAQHVDVESFAAYVALQNLLLNFDDMAGPGKNYYLWYDLDATRFTVVTSDLNLTFSGNASQGPHDNSSGFGQAMGGGGVGQERPGRDGGDAGPPDGFEPPDGGGQLPEGARQDGDQAGGGPGGGMRMGNTLKERFLEIEAFRDDYELAYRQLYQKLYVSGAAGNQLENLVATLGGVAGVDRSAVDGEASTLRATIESRQQSLASDAVITGVQ
ncbi:MAG: spore coat protein CotH [Dactylosporangium sp.]|nr:CotH kinase family protein [Dactylosporangium sp.]NNJ62693.1 spore coat protein CotH [Dactylosporangium sp.]